MLNCILRQLIESLPTIPKIVHDSYTRLTEMDHPLPQHECERLITEVAKQSKCTYLIFDALDESDGLRHRRELSQIIKRLSQDRTLRILVTSRPHTQDIFELLHEHPQVAIFFKLEVIISYLHQELLQRGIYDGFSSDFAKKLLEVLPKRAEGMYVALLI